MALALEEKIDFKLKIGDKTSVYPITVDMGMVDHDEAFEAFKEEQEEKTKALNEARDRIQALSKKIQRALEDIDDLNAEIDEESDSKKKAKLRKERKDLRSSLRSDQDELEVLNKEVDITAYQKALDDLLEATAVKSFDLNVKHDDKREALESAIEKYKIKYSAVTAEIGRLVKDAKAKKKKRS